ncbi:MAG: homoserine kinase [Planctomycetota bacterium]
MHTLTERARSIPCEVRVPASTSNLGPGFDFMGLALSLWLRVRITARAGGATHEIGELQGSARDFPRGADNLILRAFDLFCARHGVAASPFVFEAQSEIPLARGLGSSGAAVVAGLLLARAITGAPSTRGELLALGLELEGHPDNSSAALVGGCTLAVPRPDGSVCVVEQALHRELAFGLVWPTAALSTRDARRALPSQVKFHDAVENPRRLALLLEGLRTADPELLALGVEDRLHVPYRLPLIAGGAAALASARENGALAATISGSGSALLAIGRASTIAAALAAMARAIEAASGEPATSRIVQPVFGAPEVVEC